MASQRLPIPGSDDGTWGSLLNDFLEVEHSNDGSLKIRTDGTFAPATVGSTLLKANGTGGFSSATSTDIPTITESQVTNLTTDLAAKLQRTPLVSTLTPSSNTYTPNCSTTDLALIAAPTANFTIANPNPSGSASDGQRLMLRIRSGTTGYTATWGVNYSSSGVSTLPIVALPASKTVTFGFIYDATRRQVGTPRCRRSRLLMNFLAQRKTVFT